MTSNEALRFLRSHQPMPADRDLTPEVIQHYESVRRFFLENDDARCVPLFLNSFGDGSGLGVYQLVEDVIKAYSASDVVPHLAVALASNCPGVRYWCAQIAAIFPTPDLIPQLAALLDDESSDTRFAAVTRWSRSMTIVQKRLFEQLCERNQTSKFVIS